jgi:hypothetical protein
MASKSFLALALGAALLLAGPTGFGPAEAFAQACMSQGDARAAVASGEARSFSQFSGQLRQRYGDIVSSCLVNLGGSLGYLVSAVQPNGQVTTFTINAKTGR